MQSIENGSAEDKNQNFARDSPTEIFFYLIIFTKWINQQKFCKEFPHVVFFSAQFTPESESDFTRAEKK